MLSEMSTKVFKFNLTDFNNISEYVYNKYMSKNPNMYSDDMIRIDTVPGVFDKYTLYQLCNKPIPADAEITRANANIPNKDISEGDKIIKAAALAKLAITPRDITDLSGSKKNPDFKIDNIITKIGVDYGKYFKIRAPFASVDKTNAHTVAYELINEFINNLDISTYDSTVDKTIALNFWIEDKLINPLVEHNTTVNAMKRVMKIINIHKKNVSIETMRSKLQTTLSNMQELMDKEIDVVRNRHQLNYGKSIVGKTVSINRIYPATDRSEFNLDSLRNLTFIESLMTPSGYAAYLSKIDTHRNIFANDDNWIDLPDDFHIEITEDDVVKMKTAEIVKNNDMDVDKELFDKFVSGQYKPLATFINQKFTVSDKTHDKQTDRNKFYIAVVERMFDLIETAYAFDAVHIAGNNTPLSTKLNDNFISVLRRVM